MCSVSGTRKMPVTTASPYWTYANTAIVAALRALLMGRVALRTPEDSAPAACGHRPADAQVHRSSTGRRSTRARETIGGAQAAAPVRRGPPTPPNPHRPAPGPAGAARKGLPGTGLSPGAHEAGRPARSDP